jgi:cytochrome b subunit of formate dehydrogenase
VLSWSWITTTWGRIGSDPAPRARINFLLNVSLFVMMTVVVITGLVISQYALPVLGVASHGNQRWEQLHNFTSSLITIVVALHVALNWSWIKRPMRRYLARSRRNGGIESEDAA